MHGHAHALSIETGKGIGGAWYAEFKVFDSAANLLYKYAIAGNQSWPYIISALVFRLRHLTPYLSAHEITVLTYLINQCKCNHYIELFATQQVDGSVSVELADALIGQPLPSPNRMVITSTPLSSVGGNPQSVHNISGSTVVPNSADEQVKVSPVEDQDLLDLVTF